MAEKTPFDYFNNMTINSVTLADAYNLGKRAGIREVVEWVNKHLYMYPALYEYWSVQWGKPNSGNGG